MTRLPEVEGAASAAAWGVPYRRLLTLKDPLELLVERHVASRAVEIRRDIEEAKSNLTGNVTGNAVGRVLGG